LFLDSNHNLYSCGNNDDGQLGLITTGTWLTPTKAMENVFQIQAMSYGSAVIGLKKKAYL